MTKNGQNGIFGYNVKNILYKITKVCPYFVKMLVFTFVVAVSIFTATNIYSMALNILTFVSALLVDAWILKRKIKTMGYGLFVRKSHTIYCWITFLIFFVSVSVLLIECSLPDKLFVQIRDYSFVLLMAVAVISVLLETAFAIAEDD